ncbi:hypothetical protein ACLB2K_013563 [Fragaria x ananassa]
MVSKTCMVVLIYRLLQLPLTQQSLAQEKQETRVTELLDGSLRLLDVCSSATDSLLQTKECIQDLLSITRRRRAKESGVLTTEVRKYLTSRKKVLYKALENLKATANRSTFFSVPKEQETNHTIVGKII